MGTHIAGTEGLIEPGAESKRLRLMAGKVVPGTRYRILRWLGEGGMGVVYEAEHIDIERRVALKILRFDLSQQERMVQVFRDEARAASRIGSDNIVEIFDFGELSDGRLFFCMELLEGHDLVPPTEDDWTEPGRVIGIMRQCAKGLYNAHRAGIVHRDIKPENVIVHVGRDGREIVKIVDFGISAMLAAHADDEGGTIAGTPHYMAPEQIRGLPFDGRLDMYALGCMAYELLVGVPPFISEELEELLREHLAERPKSIRELKPDRDIPPELEAVIMKCLAKKPENRFVDMADLEAALCEAQIAAKLHTPWDDLPLPEVDEDRRQRILKNMPSPMDAHRKRRWLWPLVAGLSLVIGGSAVAVAMTRPAAIGQQERDMIEELTISARNAAALTHYVYPPIEDPNSSTAYQKVLELEELEGNSREHGQKRGGELRQEFATTLVTLGDKYWEVKAARPFARDYYMQSLLFEDNEHARERANVLPGWFAEFAEKARDGSFTAEELQAAKFQSAFAEEDEDKKAEKLQEALAMGGDNVAGLAATAAEEAARSSGIKVRKKRKKADDAAANEAGSAGAEDDGGDSVAGDDDMGDEGADSGDELELDEDGKKRKGRKGVRMGSSKRDPGKARDLAAQGKAALASGRRSEAESLFNQAVSYDRRNAAALSGLSDIYFDTGSNQKAVVYAERAVQAAPKNSGYRLKAGDAYFKVLRYRDALKQYQEAKKLGSNKADARIAKVKSKIGG